ncbi:MAG: serine protease [Candidatus Omnitrophica bacterium]|nr:serine protease [Candidatus Omnitrophota bacterium]
MKKFIILFTLIFFALDLSGKSENLQNNSISRLKNSLPSVVAVRSELMGIKETSPPPKGRINPLVFLAKHRRVVTISRTGAGFFLDETGLIATNSHIVNKAKKITVKTFDGKEYEAGIIKIFTEMDLAFIKIDPSPKYTPVKMADSNKVNLSDTVYTIGSSNFNKGTFIEGKIIGLGRKDTKTELLKTQIELYKGDSGAPLLNNKGELIGLLYAKGSGIKNYTLAIPSSKIIDSLKS